jgi:murein DD-endopeptidase MepM/ murein hydrolase activator NlpD
MNWTKRDFLILLALMLALALLGKPKGAASAEIVTLEGRMVQGGLVTGRTAPGAKVTLDGAPVRVRADGRFLIGFGRDAAPTARLMVTVPGGKAAEKVLAIGKRDWKIQRIDGLPPKMVTPPPEVLARIKAENEKIRKARLADTDRAMFDTGFVWPVIGRVTGVYGSQRILNGEPRRPHFGIDVAAPVGTPVVAAADGIIRIAERDLYFTGGTILIDHGYGLNSVYSHLHSVDVKPGDSVKQGQKVGTLGGTGRSTGPHLDWRVNLFLTRLDPALLVGPMPKLSSATAD